MTFTKEIVDLSNLDTDQISSKLKELNIPLTPEEALKIQNEMLGRPPSLPELVLFSIQGSCLLYTSPSPRDATLSRMPSSA